MVNHHPLEIPIVLNPSNKNKSIKEKDKELIIKLITKKNR